MATNRPALRGDEQNDDVHDDIAMSTPYTQGTRDHVMKQLQRDMQDRFTDSDLTPATSTRKTPGGRGANIIRVLMESAREDEMRRASALATMRHNPDDRRAPASTARLSPPATKQKKEDSESAGQYSDNSADGVCTSADRSSKPHTRAEVDSADRVYNSADRANKPCSRADDDARADHCDIETEYVDNTVFFRDNPPVNTQNNGARPKIYEPSNTQAFSCDERPRERERSAQLQNTDCDRPKQKTRTLNKRFSATKLPTHQVEELRQQHQEQEIARLRRENDIWEMASQMSIRSAAREDLVRRVNAAY